MSVDTSFTPCMELDLHLNKGRGFLRLCLRWVFVTVYSLPFLCLLYVGECCESV